MKALKIRSAVQVMNFHSLMRMGSAVEAAERVREYDEEVKSVIGSIFSNKNLVLDQMISSYFFVDEDEVDNPDNKYVTIYIGSDYGLCGNYNSLVVKEYNEKGHQDLKSYAIGKRIHKKLKGPKCIHITEEDLQKIDLYEELLTMFFNGDIQGIRLVNHTYISSVKHEFTPQLLLPFSPSEIKVDTINESDYMIECNFTKLMKDIITLYIKDKVYIAYVSGLAVENSVRQTVTNESLKKIDEMIFEYGIEMKKQRRMKQNAELIDMVIKAKAIEKRSKNE